jgi:predicted RNase H-like HicB family nuclease
MTGEEAPKRYSMLIQWDPEDQIYVVTGPDLAGCQTHGATWEEAVLQGQEAIESWIEAAIDAGEAIPAPRVIAA